MLSLPLLDYQLRTRSQDGKTQVWDIVRRQWIILTPEEHVRQLLITHLTESMDYPASLMAIEKAVSVGAGLVQRFDLVVYERTTHKPWLIAECKAPDVPVTDATLHQLLRYHASLQCRYWLVTNGHLHYCADAKDADNIVWIDELPAYQL